ncbi:MAG: DMT family transporter [Coriobacteriia bacterium]|nr:DMT family transporter [Coriobacteriia bacterium]
MAAQRAHPAVAVERSASASGLARVALAATTWGTIPVFVRMVHAHPVVIVFWRVMFASLVAFANLALTRRLGSLKTLSRRRFAALLAMGCLLALNWALYLGSLKLTTVAVAVLLAYLGPVLVAVLTPVLGSEGFDRRLLVPMGFALAGVVAIVGPRDLGIRSHREWLGAAMALASAFTYAGLVLNAKRLLRGIPTGVYMLGEYVGAAAVLLPAALLLKGPSTLSDWVGVAALGVVDTGLTGMLFLSGLRSVRADHAAMLTYAEPVSAVLFSAALLGETITAWTALGGALVVASGIMVARMQPQPAFEAPEAIQKQEGR